MAVKTMTFISACKDFFQLMPGQTLIAFRDEIKTLTPKDREEIIQGLEQNGYKIEAVGVHN